MTARVLVASAHARRAAQLAEQCPSAIVVTSADAFERVRSTRIWNVVVFDREAEPFPFESLGGRAAIVELGATVDRVVLGHRVVAVATIAGVAAAIERALAEDAYVPPVHPFTPIHRLLARAGRPSSPPARTPRDGVVLTGRVLSYESGRPIAGARITTENQDTFTDGDGYYLLNGLRPNHAYEIAIECDGRGGILFQWHSRVGDWMHAPIEVPSWLTMQLARVMLGRPPSTRMGGVSIFCVSEPLCSPAAANRRVEGAVVRIHGRYEARVLYLDPSQQVDRSLRATSRAGLALAIDLAPGEYTVDVSHPNGEGVPCDDHWPERRFVVRAGMLTDVRFRIAAR